VPVVRVVARRHSRLVLCLLHALDELQALGPCRFDCLAGAVILCTHPLSALVFPLLPSPPTVQLAVLGLRRGCGSWTSLARRGTSVVAHPVEQAIPPPASPVSVCIPEPTPATRESPHHHRKCTYRQFLALRRPSLAFHRGPSSRLALGCALHFAKIVVA
jgi:hypothetical protein